MQNENKNFTVTMACNQFSRNKCDSDSHKYKASTADKKVTFVNVQQHSSKSCLCFLNMYIFAITVSISAVSMWLVFSLLHRKLTQSHP